MTEVLVFQEDDGLTAVRSRLRDVKDGKVIISLPWDAQVLSRNLDCEIVHREAERGGFELAIVSPDPERRAFVRQAGLPAFATVAEAQAVSEWSRRRKEKIEPPPEYWWEEDSPPPTPQVPVTARLPRPVRQGARAIVFVGTLLVVLVSSYLAIPQASVAVVPAGDLVQVIVPVSVSTELEVVDTAAGVVPARRVGDYFEGYLEVETTGTVDYQTGRSRGTVLFTNLLPQDVVVLAGTALRTSSSSFPVRFATTQEVTVPAQGQAPAPVESLVEGPVGNVGVNQINQVEGVTGFAIRVTNPEPTFGGSTNEVRAVSQADMDRAWDLIAERVLDEAHEALQIYLEPTEFIPRQSLAIQSAESSYNRFLHERADTVGLHVRLLITGLAVDQDNAEAVAYVELLRRMPEGHELIGARFEVGEMVEEPLGTEGLTFFATATGYAVASLDPGAIREAVLGQPVDQASEIIGSEFPLLRTPQVVVWPEWFPRMPVLPVRIQVEITPQG